MDKYVIKQRSDAYAELIILENITVDFISERVYTENAPKLENIYASVL
jgi:hypothetical protein